MKVKWSLAAKEQLREIIRFYNKRNRSPRYGNRLKSSIRQITRYISTSPMYGEYLELEGKRRVCIEYFELLYEVKDGFIEISSFRDARRNWQR